VNRAFLLALAVLAAPALAQAPAETPSPARTPEAQKGERRTLDLRLDNPSSFATVAPEPPKPLPTLGGDARPISSGGVSAPPRDPIPKDTNPGGR